MKKLLFAASIFFSVLACVADKPAQTAKPEDARQADLVKRQARSVHLQYGIGGEFTGAQATVKVVETQPQTYFSIIGWHQGYCGIQDWGDERVFIFSVWDPTDPDDYEIKAEDMKEELRAKVLYHDPKVSVSRFGGEGSGAKTLAGLAWKEGQGVTARIECEPDGKDRIAFTCSAKLEGSEEWMKIATISTIRDAKVKGLGFIASFVEDFRRDYQSAKVSREAEFYDVAVKPAGSAEWTKVTQAAFTADDTPSTNIDAGRRGEGTFFLKTGGDTVNGHTPLWTWIN